MCVCEGTRWFLKKEKGSAKKEYEESGERI